MTETRINKEQSELLEVRNLRTRIATRDVDVRAVEGVSFSIRRGEIFGIAGESGSGKSMTAFSILKLLPQHGRVASGEVNFKGRNLASLSEVEMRRIRGNEISMIFQDPMSSLNPVYTIGAQITEALMLHRSMNRREARAETVRLLELVNIPDAAWRYKSYPHEFSGGMRQRVMIAMAVSCSPDLLIADEPTTALDVTVERQILALLQEMRRTSGTAIMLITHNLNMMAEHCDRIAVMYAGEIVEIAETAELFANPRHPYTRALLNALPRQHISKERLIPLSGRPAVIKGEKNGCSFAPRCLSATPGCFDGIPRAHEISPDHVVRCRLYGE